MCTFICTGGKDSLVVWHEHKSIAQQPLLLYVADGLDEFHTSKRLQEVIRLTGDKFTLGTVHCIHITLTTAIHCIPVSGSANVDCCGVFCIPSFCGAESEINDCCLVSLYIAFMQCGTSSTTTISTARSARTCAPARTPGQPWCSSTLCLYV